MNGVWAFLSIAGISALSVLGYLLLSRRRKAEDRAIFVLVSLAVGVLFGDVFFHMLPELFAEPAVVRWTPTAVVAGFLVFFSLEKFLRWRHCHLPVGGHHHHPIVSMTLTGDALHNLLDGLAVGAAYSISLDLGLATTLAVFCHELPAELGRYAVLLANGMRPRQALLFNFLSTLTSFVGLATALTMAHLSGTFAGLVTGLTAGGFLYVAGSDLVPDLHHELDAGRSSVQLAAILAGLGLMAGLKSLLG